MLVALEEFKEIDITLSADGRGRVTLGNIAKSKKYIVSQNAVGQLLLTPAVVIPEYEQWLWKNPVALAAVQEGLKEAAEGKGRVVDFSRYADSEIDD